MARVISSTRTLILSDVHLSTLSPAADRPDRRPGGPSGIVDAALSSTIEHAIVRARRAAAPLEIILAGDVLDLDAPPADAYEPDLQGRRTEAGAVYLAHRILVEHPVATRALTYAISSGARVVCLPGNHDAQIVFRRVRRTIMESILRPLLPQADMPIGRLADRLLFRSWFHVAPGGVLVEHGHQYDPICRMTSLTPGFGDRLENTIGTILSHRAPALLPSADPYAIDPTAGMHVGDLLAACSDKPACAAALAGDLLRIADLGPWDAKLGTDTWTRGRAELFAHQELFAPKADAATSLDAFCTKNYEYGLDVEARMRNAMLGLMTIYGVRTVVMGHTHDAFVERNARGRVIVNSGSWTPSVNRLGTFVWIETDGSVQRVSLGTVGHDGGVGWA